MGAFVYILRCADDSFYVGTTRATLSTNASHSMKTERSVVTRELVGL